MRILSRPPASTIAAFCGVCLGLAALPCVQAQAAEQAAAALRKVRTIPALMVSDIHFDPFHDPGKVKELIAAPVSRWHSILDGPPSPAQQQAFDALQASCHTRGVDTPFALLRSSLEAMQASQPDAKFITVSGDLIAHQFTCRYSTLAPGSKPEDYQAFVLKTLAFVMDQLRATFPGIPIYATLGNNDTACGDYQLDAESAFLAATGSILAQGLPASQRAHALREFAVNGSYSVAMARPMRGTRIVVLNDLFLSPKYATCAGKPDPAAAAGELTWLEQQLARARQAGQKVWVMGHIPPGIDPYSTVAKFRDVCAGQAPVAFLATDKMAGLLAAYADVVRLGIFAHTHMDEVRLLRSEGSDTAAGAPSVAVKVVPSISPVDGNNPSFTVARIDPSAASLRDYDVISASNQTGTETKWTPEYNFAETYRETQFSSANVEELIDAFHADGDAKTALSQAYIRNYFAGDMSRELTPFWPEYVCALDNHSAKAFAACVCPAAK